MVFVLSYPIKQKNSSKITSLKKWRKRNPSTFFYMEFKTLLFQNKKLTWWRGQPTSLILRSTLRPNFGCWNKTELKFDQDLHKPNLLVLNFEEVSLFNHWFQQRKLKIVLLSFPLQNRFKGLAPLPSFYPNGLWDRQKFVNRHLCHSVQKF